ncbi:alpha/beta fold hydrolase [Verrucomicrobiaceae bacterium 227]
MMEKYLKASLVADALSLGSHWIYNQGKIARLHPNGVSVFSDPATDYHSGKSAGNLTHYGDQTVLLSESLKARGGFDREGWREDWLAGMADFQGYLDGASKDTLKSEGRSASSSNDLAGASRIAPILDLDLSQDEKIAAARAQTALTHGDPEVVDVAEFFVRAVTAIEGGAVIGAALDQAAIEGNYDALDAQAALATARKQSEDFLKVSQELGLTCHLPEAFPLTLYFALRSGDFSSVMSENALAGGDNSARAMLLAVLFAARDGEVGEDLAKGLKLTSNSEVQELSPGANPVTLTYDGKTLAGVLEMPEGKVEATAIFAHCFTCGKDFVPGARISRGLASRGIATLRIDFSGIGQSSGEFADSSFLTNLDDLIYAAKWLGEQLQSPCLLVGHSLGGAAVLAAAGKIEGVKAVATIGAPSDPGHVTGMFADDLARIEAEGKAEVSLGGRPFVIGKRFLTDLKEYDQKAVLGALRGVDVLIMHSPVDEVVGIENAGEIYSALYHPKSFVSLAGANHLLTNAKDAEYASDLIRVWASRVV